MSKAPTRIAVVMATFNRRETTLRCLRSLAAQETSDIELRVYLLDDASPDETAAIVRRQFPQAHVIDGDGNRFWGGGMHLAMQAALSAPFDFMLWLNDDVELKPGAIRSLLATHAQVSANDDSGHVIIGAMMDPKSGNTSYAGFNRRNSWHPAQLLPASPSPDEVTACDTMNGNCVLVPSDLVDRIGIIDPVFVQQLGDIDYGYRVRRAGGKLWIAREAAGFCEPNNKPRRWQDPSLSLVERLKVLNTPHGLPLKPWLTFMYRYAGGFGIALLGISYAKALARSRRLV